MSTLWRRVTGAWQRRGRSDITDTTGSAILLETGDALLTETDERLVLE